tara:strand:- start:1942 stop:2586 length:645 start_codon:yes stop_codon:yes gene_type:complete
MPEVNNISIVIPVLVCAISGMLIYLVHGFFLNRYLLMQNNLIIAIILPTVALVITRAISSNFFLSLGMIGALSIIRYRTPVKSSYELALLFSLITTGIVGNINYKYSIGLSVFVSSIAVLFFIFKKTFPNAAKKIDEKKINEFEMVITVDERDIEFLKKYSEYISSIEDYTSEDKKKKTVYCLTLQNMIEAQKIREEIINEKNIDSISISPKYV